MKSYPLLQSQLGVLIQSMQHPKSTQYNLPNYIFMPLSMTMERVASATRTLLQSFPELHTRFVVGEQGEVRQWCDMSMAIPVVTRKCSEDELQAYFNDGFVRPFDLFGSEPLFRVEIIETEKSLCLLSDGHHAIVDGMSFSPVLTSAFAKLFEGGSIEPQPYGLYQAAEDESASFGSPLYQRAKAYYAQKFAGLEMATLSRSQYGTMGRMGRSMATISRRACDDWCREHGVQPNLLFQAAFSHVLSVLTRQQQVAYAAVNHGRMDKRLRGCVGMFVKTVPVLVDADPSQRVVDFVKSLRGELMSTIRYGIYPFTHFCSDLGMKPGVTFDFLAVADMEEHVMLNDGEMRAVQPVRKEIDSDLSVDIYLKGESYEIRVQSSLTMNDAQTIQMVTEAIKVAVCNMITHPDATLGELDIVSSDERDALIALGTGKHLDIDPEMTFVKAFEQCASRVPENLAVADDKNSMTYGELSHRSDVLAHRLIACGVKPGDFVAVLLDRTIAFPLVVIAIHKAGAAYVPIDLEYPEERQQYMLRDCQAKVVIDSQFMAGTDFSQDATPIDLSTADGLAYMIYTSGSTGKPKGVMIGQRGLTSYIASMTDVLGITASDRISLHRPFAFDAHIQDLYPVLTIGGSLHIMPSKIRRDIQDMRDFISRHGITGGSYTTSLGKLLIESGPLPLRYMTLTGERMADMVSGDVQLFNGYGPTECTDLISAYRLERGRSYTNIPIGRPMADSHCFIVDTQGRLLPRGAEGELCFAGVQVSVGYWHQPGLTAERFCDCPFLPLGEDGRPVRMYRTGDLCRWNEEGQLEFLGRSDEQVKLRGFRIELGEIESQAMRLEGISQAVAAVHEGYLLCLYYVGKGGSSIDREGLRDFLAKSLPEYMVPAAYIQLDDLPLTPNGKTDRKRLPAPDMASGTPYVAPEGDTEKKVAAAFAEVLDLKSPVGALDGFFALGGDSIKAIRLVNRLRDGGILTQVGDVMRLKSVRAIAEEAKSGVQTDIPQEAVTGEIHPSAIQRRFLQWNLPNPGHFNQAVALSGTLPLSPVLLREAVESVAIHHDILRSVVREGKIIVRDIRERELVGFSERDFRGLPDCRSAMEKEADRINISMDLREGPLLKAALWHTDKGDHVLLVCHHLCCDGVSWRIITEDLNTAYRQLLEGSKVKLPPKTHAFARYTETLQRYRDSHLLLREKRYWTGLEERMERLPLAGGCTLSGMRETLEACLEGDALRQLLTTAGRAYNTDVNDLLVTALCQAYRQLTGECDVAVLMEGHGREPMHERLLTDRTVGWFTSVFPFVAEGISGDTRHDIRLVKETFREVPNKGMGYGILQYIRSVKGDGALRTDLVPMLGFNYLGQMEEERAGDLLKTAYGIPTGLTVSPENAPAAAPPMDINCIVERGKFRAGISYDTGAWTEGQAQALAEAFIARLEAVAEHTRQVGHTEQTASDLGAEGWTDGQFTAICSRFGERGEHLRRIYPLTPMQEGMLLEYLKDRTTTAYRLVFRYAVDALPSEQALQDALDWLAERHETLRTSILYEGVPYPCQAVTDRRFRMEFIDLTGEQDTEGAASRIHKEMQQRSLSLQYDPLFGITCLKTSADTCQLIFSVHHIITDGWSLPIYMGDFLTSLEAGMTGTDLPSSDIQAGRYERFVRELRDKDMDAGLAYWKGLLQGYETRAAIPSYGKPAEKDSEPFVRHTLDRSLTASLHELAARAQCTMNTVMELAWGLTLQAYCRTDDAVFAKVVSGRSSSEMKTDDIVGIFINSVPVRVRTGKDETVIQALGKLQEQASETANWDFCPLAEIQAQTGLGPEMLQSTLAFENYPVPQGIDELLERWNFRTVQVEEEPFNELSIIIVQCADGTIGIRLTYDANLYPQEEMKTVACTFTGILTSMAGTPDSRISELQLVNEEEEQATLIKLGKGKHLDIDPQMTFVKAFEQCARQNPDRLAVADATGSLTYGELSHRSDVLAHRLIACGVKPGDFVAVMLPRTIAFPLAVIAIHKAGAAYVPVDLEYPEERRKYMLDDSGAGIVVDDRFMAGTDFAAGASPIDLSSPGGLAYMIYTSGSTGKPKGAMFHQAGLWNLILSVIDAQELTGADRLAGHCSFSFDVHIADLFPILTLGGSFHVMPSAIRLDLDAIRRFLIDHQITGGGYATPIAKLLLDKFGDLPLRFIGPGGEKLTSVHSDHMTIINGYGPTECCYTSFYKIAPGIRLGDVPIGRPVANCYYFIVDSRGRLLPRGTVGELCIAGIQVGRGYWHQPELTAEKFCDCPFVRENIDGTPVRMYHTGDLCRWNEDGEMEYIGRIDDQVKLRGYRIELGEIEACASRFEGISHVVAVVRPVSGNDTLCLYYTADAADPEALKGYLSENLPAYMVPAVFEQLDALPLTPNGKVDRRRLPEPRLQQDALEAPATELEQQLFDIVAEQLGTTAFGVTTDLVTIGLSSLGAMRLSMVIGQRTGLQIPVGDLLGTPTIRHMAELAGQPRDTSGTDLTAFRRRQDHYPLTATQRGIHIDWELNRDTTQYNIPVAVCLGQTDPGLLADALRQVIQAHSYVKTRLAEHGGGIVQLRRDDAPVQISVSTVDSEPDRDFFQQRVRPFNLFTDDLYRLEIYTCGGRTWLFRDFHHIVTDGLSDAVFFRDLLAALHGTQPREEQATAFDYALYEEQLMATDRYEEARHYFDALVSETEAASYPRSAGGTDHRSAHVQATVAGSESVREACRRMGITPNSYFQTVVAQVLHRLTRQERLMLATVSSGRSLAQTRDVMGLFVKTLPMVSAASPNDTTFTDAARAMHRQSIESIGYDFYPLAETVERHGLHPEILYAFEEGIFDIAGPVINSDADVIVPELDTQKMPIELIVYTDRNGAYVLHLGYDSAFYTQSSMAALANAITAYAAHAAGDGILLGDIDMTTREERDALVALGTGKRLDIDPQMTFVKAFEQCARQNPDRLAVADATDSLTYGELSHRSDVLAHRLIACGVKPGDFVAVMLPRTIAFPLAVIAIHKAGAAYVPVDLEYPEERRKYMLDDSGAGIVVDDRFMAGTDFAAGASPIDLSSPGGLAYMIYTSGSTGKPKGAVLHQAGLWNLIQNVIDVQELTGADRIAGHSSFSFDAHIVDLFPILTLGGSFHVMPSAIRLDLDAIRRFLIDHQITGGGYATPIAKLLLDKFGDLPLRFIGPGGEKLTSVHSDHMTIINGYGPTECTCGTSYYKIAPGIRLHDVPIGRPVANCYYFIVDPAGRLLPRGASGELCIAGIQVGNGYWHRPELTAEKFCDCPFVTENIDGTPVRMYHTGDLCRWNEDGEMEYIGRIDDQVKLRGYRIELGEIEACASRFGGIRQAVAVIRELSGSNALCLYYTAEEPDKTIDTDELRRFMGKTLADYMVPAAYTRLDALPLTPNGKVDRRRLPEPSVTSTLEAVPPRTEKESVVLLIAQQVLGRDDFGITDDLFDLGLTSIAAIKVATMSGVYGIRISVNNLMRLRTIERLFAAETPVGYWFNAYNPEKPVLIVPHGIVPAISMSEKFQEWQDHFSIYTLEPTEEHATRFAPDNDYERLVDAYAGYMYRDIPEDAHVFGFLGYSWGGEVGYSLATRWQQKRGGIPRVYLCDTPFSSPDTPKMTEEQITQGIIQYLMTHAADFDTGGLQTDGDGENGGVMGMALIKCGKDAGFAGEVLKIATKKFYSAEVYRRIRPLLAYDGHMTYFACTRDNPHMEETLSEWEKLAPTMEVIHVDDNHMNFAIRNDKTYVVTERLLADLNRWRENGEQ